MAGQHVTELEKILMSDSHKEGLAEPIATAPRDVTVILALDYLGYTHIVCGDERGLLDTATREKKEELTHWSPIRALPAS